ncbi:hypothetical protein CAEBREN_10261 [Caenorhabditis brenneri]|uniref:RING-type domain-containing protein n=1 Tax=Caenorhabditis brenneri TaxID=135651 RepID=G0N820_CAEBE|nr:hypothetical protein CAEBREN_10261 [Caenorhabditis brenneri]
MAIKITKDEAAPNISLAVLMIYFFVFIGIIVYGLYRIPFGGPITHEEYSLAVPVVITWIAVVILDQIVFKFVKFCHRNSQLGRHAQCQNFLLVSTGLCIFFGFLPRIVVFFNYEWYMWYSMYVSLIGIVLSFNTHMSFHANICKIKRSWNDGRSWVIFLAQLAFMVALFFYLGEQSMHFNHIHAPAIFFCHLGFSFVCAVATIDFCYLRRGMIKMNHKLTDQQQKAFFEFYGLPAIHENEEQLGELESIYECEVCNKHYNQTNRTPRILKECGHTICEECGDKQLKKKNGQFLHCPHCNTVTLVNGE